MDAPPRAPTQLTNTNARPHPQVVPMLNPDGVANGNYRCSLAGCDLNRLWDEPPRHIAPPIHALKRLIRDVSRTTVRGLYHV